MRLEIERSKCSCIRPNGAVASTENVGTRISLQVVMTGPTDDLVSTAAAQCALAARGDQVLLLGGLGGLLLLIEEPELHLSPYGSRRRWAREKNWRSAERGRFRSSVSSRVSTRFLRFVRRSARAEMWHGERRCETLGRDSHIYRRVAGAVRRSSSVQRLTLSGLA